MTMRDVKAGGGSALSTRSQPLQAEANLSVKRTSTGTRLLEASKTILQFVGRSLKAVIVTAGGVVGILIIVILIGLILTAGTSPANLAMIAMFGVFVWVVVMMGTGGMPASWVSNATRPVALVFVIVLFLFTLFIMLGAFSLLEEFIIIFPFVAAFPFSYLAYFAFQRPKRIADLKRDFALLDERWDDSLYQRSQGFLNYALHITLACLFTILGLLIFFLPSLIPPTQLERLASIGLQEEVLRAMRFGFVGAYLFSWQLIYRRYTTSDLQPYVYMYCAMAILAGMIINYFVFQVIYVLPDGSSVGAQAELGGLASGLGDFVAAALGFFPLLAIQWLTSLAYSTLRQERRRSDEMRLDMVDGISQFHEIRLRDNGIDSMEDLKNADIPILLVQTTFNAEQLIDWMDQSILFLRLDTGETELFRRTKLRRASEYLDFWRDLVDGPTEIVTPELRAWRDERRKDAALQLQNNPQVLDNLYWRMNSDFKAQYVLKFRRNSTAILLNPQYNELLADAYEATDETMFRALQDEAAEYLSRSEGKVRERSAISLAGRGKLEYYSYLTNTQLSNMKVARERLAKAIDAFTQATISSRLVERVAIEELKKLADINIDFAVGEADEAMRVGDPSRDEWKHHVAEAMRLIDEAIETSRLFYPSGTANVGFVADKARLQVEIDRPEDALHTLGSAKETCRRLRISSLQARIDQVEDRAIRRTRDKIERLAQAAQAALNDPAPGVEAPRRAYQLVEEAIAVAERVDSIDMTNRPEAELLRNEFGIFRSADGHMITGAGPGRSQLIQLKDDAEKAVFERLGQSVKLADVRVMTVPRAALSRSIGVVEAAAASTVSASARATSTLPAVVPVTPPRPPQYPISPEGMPETPAIAPRPAANAARVTDASSSAGRPSSSGSIPPRAQPIAPAAPVRVVDRTPDTFSSVGAPGAGVNTAPPTNGTDISPAANGAASPTNAAPSGAQTSAPTPADPVADAAAAFAPVRVAGPLNAEPSAIVEGEVMGGAGGAPPYASRKDLPTDGELAAAGMIDGVAAETPAPLAEDSLEAPAPTTDDEDQSVG